jgi:N-methylhydantoinase B
MVSTALAAIQRQIQWNRLVAVVEEQAQIMIRTAFSTTVREAGDLSAGVFDLQGRMLAQAVTGTPGHVNSMMESVGHFLQKFPAETMRPGDHYITNDPWLGTGHLHDLTVVTPAFRGGRIVGLFANTAHVIDVGGLGMGPEGGASSRKGSTSRS